MPKNNVLVNDRSAVTGNSEGTVAAFPDACKTPSPAGPVPIPYPNVARSGDLQDGSTSVTFGGAPVCLESSYFEPSMGDEAGSAGGVVSSKLKGKAEPVMCSFNVQVEGKGVARNFDPFICNDKNTPPSPVMQMEPVPTVALAAASASEKDEEAKCSYCGKKEHKFAEKWGNSVGNSQALERNIFAGADKKRHPWWAGSWSLQAHHLICSEAFDDAEWPALCRQFGYDVNRKENGVMLPNSMALACQIHAPLHRGPHDAGEADGLPYPARVKQLADEYKQNAKDGAYCGNPDGFASDLDGLSRDILEKVDAFKYTLTDDGHDYPAGGVGCAGATSVTDKKERPCPAERCHRLKLAGTGAVIGRKMSPLKVGE